MKNAISRRISSARMVCVNVKILAFTGTKNHLIAVFFIKIFLLAILKFKNILFCIVPKLNLYESCSSSVCNDLVGLSCQNGMCKCGANSYWKDAKCGIFIFTLTLIFYLNINLLFLKKVNANGFNQRCTGNEECDKSRNLMCKEGICQCKDLSLYWNEKSSSCGINFYI